MIILTIILLSFLLSQLWAIQQISITNKEADKNIGHILEGLSEDQYPTISLLIAVRNEEKDILRCLKSVEALQYPKDKLEIWIGDDASEDDTASIIHDFIKDKPNYHYMYIDKKVGHCIGKSNILAQLAHKANGLWYFYTDADIALPKQWITAMLSNALPEEKILMGFTNIEGKGFFERMQTIDWSFALGMLYLFMSRKKPVTTMGNNMAVHKDVYWSIGGYEGIKPSIVEDFTLFKTLVAKGHDFRQIIRKDTAALSTPIHGYKNLLRQRKRWMQGALELPWYMSAYLLFQASFLPLLLFFTYKYYDFAWIAMIILSAKTTLQSIFISKVFAKVGQKVNPLELLLYDLHASIQSIILLIYNLLPTGVIWKGRKY